jgi:hypothetical protein
MRCDNTTCGPFAESGWQAEPTKAWTSKPNGGESLSQCLASFVPSRNVASFRAMRPAPTAGVWPPDTGGNLRGVYD